ncbi:octaprenyl-diphosphate synthase IspB [Alishewanella longhuensis]
MGTAAQQQLIREAITEGNRMAHLSLIMAALQETGAFDYTREIAQQEALKAKAALLLLPASEYKTALSALADIAISRSH